MTVETLQQTVEDGTEPGQDQTAEATAHFESLLDDETGPIESDPSLEEDSQQDATKAPEDGNPDGESPKAPDDAAPAEDAPKEAGDDDTGTNEGEAPAEGTEEATAKAEADKAAAELQNDLLGANPEDTSDDIEVWKKRKSDTDRHVGELQCQLSDFNGVLASAGRKIVQTADGPKLVPTEDAKDFSPEDYGVDHANLSEQEKALFETAPAEATKMIVDKVLNSVANGVTPIQAQASDAVLTQAQVNDTYRDFVGSKLRDGTTPRYPDADSDAVKDLMSKAYNADTPGMNELRDLADKNADVHHLMLEHVWLKTFRARSAQLAAKAATTKATEERKKVTAQEVSDSSSGAGGAPKGTQQQAPANDAVAHHENVLDNVVI